MTKVRLEDFLNDVEITVGQTILLLPNINAILRELDFPIEETTLRANFSGKKINLENYGIAPKTYGLKPNIAIYSEFAVWEYLEKLNNTGKINLADAGIKSFQDIIKKEYSKIARDELWGYTISHPM